MVIHPPQPKLKTDSRVKTDKSDFKEKIAVAINFNGSIFNRAITFNKIMEASTYVIIPKNSN